VKVCKHEGILSHTPKQMASYSGMIHGNGEEGFYGPVSFR